MTRGCQFPRRRLALHGRRSQSQGQEHHAPHAADATRELRRGRARRQSPVRVGPRADAHRGRQDDGARQGRQGPFDRAGRAGRARRRAEPPRDGANAARQPRQGQAHREGARHGERHRGLRRAAQGHERLLRPHGRGVRRADRQARALGGGHGLAADADSGRDRDDRGGRVDDRAARPRRHRDLADVPRHPRPHQRRRAARPVHRRRRAVARLDHPHPPQPRLSAPPPGLAAAVKFDIRQAPQYALARQRVRHVGEIVAMVVADDRGRAEDAVEAIEVQWAPLPPAVDMLTAGEAGAPLVHPDWGTNVAVGFSHAIGDAGRALAGADVVLEETFRIQRYVGMPLEGRGVVAAWDRRDGTLTTWNSTQVSHFVQQGLVTALELLPHRIRVIAPDLGGGFGTKASGYPEDALIPIAARALGRPVKWIEDRREHMMGAAHARHQTHTIRLGARRDGTIVGLADRIWLDLGAYNVWGVVLPYNTVAHLIGPYRIRDMKVDVRAVVTNKPPNAPYRGAGRPETVFAMDRAVDCLARRLGLDPADVRRKNYIRPEELPFDFGMPYRDGNPLVYDSGDFPAALESALTAAEYDRVRKEQESLRARGVWRGIGISGYVEGTAIGPFEGARVTLDAAGRVRVATGARCSGQGHETSFAQVAADALGVPLDWVTVTGGDTAGVPFGVGTFASRSGVTAGNSIVDAARRVRAKVLAAAGALLEAAPQDLEIEDGRGVVRGAPQRALDL